jgi:hypothetical protein
VLLGNGNGTFQAAKSYPAGTNPTTIAVGDLNGDGKPDVVTASGSNATGGYLFNVALNNGDGSFATSTAIAAQNSVQQLAIADVTGDGIPDVLAAQCCGAGAYLGVLVGGGDGTFTSETDILPDRNIRTVNVVDVNGDGLPDILYTNGVVNLSGVMAAALQLPDPTNTSMSSPAPGATLGSTSATFNWAAVTGATGYLLTIGSTFQASDVFVGTATGTSLAVSGLPTDGRTLYVMVSPFFNGFYNGGSTFLYTAMTAGTVGVTIATNPAGLSITVDSAAITAPQTLQWTPGSQHTLSVTSPQGTGGTQYLFGSWSDSGAQTHTITAPASATTYTASFTAQYLLTTVVSGSGTITANPSSTNGYYNSGASVSLTANPSTGYQFAGWVGTGSGSYTGNNNPASITMNGPVTETASFVPTCSITLASNPAGLTVQLDGTSYSAPQTLSVTCSSSHTIGTTTPQAGGTGTQYVWSSWSDNGAISHSVTAPASGSSTYTASFITQYYLTMNAGSGGTVSPASAWYNSGQGVSISATPNTNYTFGGWSGGGTGSYSGSNNPASVTINGAITETASFTPPGCSITLASNPAGLTVQLDGTSYSAPQTLSVTCSSSHTIGTMTPQGQYAWLDWSDGGTISHSITAPASGSATYTANFTTIATGLYFYPVTPCRVADTRSGSGKTGSFGPPSITGGTNRAFPIPSSGCGIPTSAAAYSLNVTVVPPGQVIYLTTWSTGQSMPTVSTLNDFSGQVSTPGNVVANAAIVPAGTGGSVSIFVSDTSDVIIDINGYFAPAGTGGLSFYPLTPCRVADTRGYGFTGAFGPPTMAGGSNRSFPIPQSSCNVPSIAQAYSLNMTVVPSGQLVYLTTWQSGQSMPTVSTLNDFSNGIPAQAMGKVVANAAIVPAGTSGAVSVFVSDSTDVIIDINGYFATPGLGGDLLFYTTTPCRVADTRGNGFSGSFGPPTMAASTTRTFPIPQSSCVVPSTAQAYSLNMTVVPPNQLIYLTTWPYGRSQPAVSTLNDFSNGTVVPGRVVANAAIVPAGTSGSISVFVSDTTDVIIDINGYFAP